MTDGHGRWSTPVGDGSVGLELYEDEMDDWPPLVEVRAERDALSLKADIARWALVAACVDGWADGPGAFCSYVRAAAEALGCEVEFGPDVDWPQASAHPDVPDFGEDYDR